MFENWRNEKKTMTIISKTASLKQTSLEDQI